MPRLSSTALFALTALLPHTRPALPDAQLRPSLTSLISYPAACSRVGGRLPPCLPLEPPGEEGQMPLLHPEQSNLFDICSGERSDERGGERGRGGEGGGTRGGAITEQTPSDDGLSRK